MKLACAECGKEAVRKWNGKLRCWECGFEPSDETPYNEEVKLSHKQALEVLHGFFWESASKSTDEFREVAASSLEMEMAKSRANWANNQLEVEGIVFGEFYALRQFCFVEASGKTKMPSQSFRYLSRNLYVTFIERYSKVYRIPANASLFRDWHSSVDAYHSCKSLFSKKDGPRDS